MIILIPMGGHGSRFTQAGYTINKACIPTTDRHSGKSLPMVVCAMQDIPGIHDKNNKIICVDRDFHAKDGTEQTILDFFPQTIFIHDHVLLDQAYGCFLAREFLQSEEELFIAACDNGMEMDLEAFKALKHRCDAVMISHTNDKNIAQNPLAHSWAKLKTPDDTQLSHISLKQTVSDHPMYDHATTGMFWFKKSCEFLAFLEKMIWARDTLSGKYYVDKLLQYYIDAGKSVHYFDVHFICWGMPQDYEIYEKTLSYWKKFAYEEGLIS